MFSAGSKETMDRIVGIEVLSPHKIVLYVNYIFPACDEKIADYFGNVGYHAEMGLMCPSLPLEIVEAMQEIIVNGSASGAKYSFSDIEGCEQFDLLTPLHVADIKAKLKQLKAENHIPSCIKIDQKDMERRYDAAINWIDERGNALISNGPFYVYSWDFANQFLELRRFEGYTRL
jgi:peptide/nickel transport system substrate-binding protein